MELYKTNTIVPQIQDETFLDLKKNLMLVKETDESFAGYGQGLVMRHKKLKIDIFYCSKTFDIEEAFIKSREEAELRGQMKGATILKLIKSSSNQNDLLCGSIYKLHHIYEYASESLFELIQQRIKAKIYFDENELWVILDCILSALLFLQKNQIRHGWIQPKNIFFNQQYHIYQLTDIRYLKELYEYKSQVLGFNEQCYLSPYLFDQLGKRTINPIYNYEKSEIFSLGLTLAQSCTLQEVQIIYNFQNYRVIQERVDGIIKLIQQKYSKQLTDVIASMLKIDENQRISVAQLAQNINKQMKGDCISIQFFKVHYENPDVVKVIPESKNEQIRYISPVRNNYHYTKPVRPFQIDQILEQTNNTYKHSQSQMSPTKPLEKTRKKQLPRSIERINWTLNQKINQFDSDLLKLQKNFQQMNNRQSFNNESSDQHPMERINLMHHQDDLNIGAIRIQSPKHRHNNNKQFDDDFDRLEKKLDNKWVQEKLNQIAQSKSDHFSPLRYAQESEIVASLPRSNMIYMHSSKPSSLNDFFYY